MFQIYEDIVEGKLFQTISCYKPRSLTVLKSGEETLIAFIEGDSLIRVSFLLYSFKIHVLSHQKIYFCFYISDIYLSWNWGFHRIYIISFTCIRIITHHKQHWFKTRSIAVSRKLFSHKLRKRGMVFKGYYNWTL